MNDTHHTPGAEGTASESTERPGVGTLVIDMARMRLGRVMDYVGARAQLRPPAGGCEWDVSPEYIREARGDEILHASVAEISQAPKGQAS
ncbi:hypothetical protein ABZ953_00240 [Streptomyces sp. NPDC046465]|uniref:hypothetical protein n=1 Tax=Streptomyces sp. NPDC046465 TaxID=3155810 RepID=UPI0033EB8692